MLSEALSQCHTLQDYTTQSVSLLSKAERKSKFTSNDDLVIARELFAADAHFAQHRDRFSRFEVHARNANQKPHFKHEMSSENLQDRFKKLTGDFARRDNRDRLMSSIKDGIGSVGICWKPSATCMSVRISIKL